MKKIVVFASGSGTNFQSIIDAVQGGKISATITGLICDKNNIGAIERAEKNEIPHRVIPPSFFSTEIQFANELLLQLKKWDADLIVLAGYLKKIPATVIQEYQHRILNIHPSLLPKYGGKGFYGMKVHQAVINSAEQESGCSVHIVTEEFDEGPVIAQKRIKIKENETPEDLAERILKEEHQLYPAAIQKHIETLES